MFYDDLRLQKDLQYAYYFAKRSVGRELQMYRRTGEVRDPETGNVTVSRNVVTFIGVVSDLTSQIAKAQGSQALVYGMMFELTDRLILTEYDEQFVGDEYCYFIIDGARYNYVQHKVLGPNALIAIKAVHVTNEPMEREITCNVEHVLLLEQDLDATV